MLRGFTALLMIIACYFVVPVSALDVVVPEEFFDYSIDINVDPFDGYNFMAPGARDANGDRYSFVTIMDNDGEIVYFKKTPPGSYFYNFTPFPELGLFAYVDRNSDPSKYYVMDLTYTLVDSIIPANGFPLDNHEILIFGEDEDRRYWVIGDDERPIDMSEIVEGGDPDAIVLGMVIQELDADGGVIWEWKSLDHTDEIPITDAEGYRDLTDDYIDYLHTNAIEIDTDSNVMLSQRGTSEITKINYDTQEVIWRWGGGPGNMFDFVDDLPGQDSAFYLMHDIRRLDNGNVVIFDNGGLREEQVSFAKEYILDEENLTATLVWSYAQDPESYSRARGGHRILENGNHLIGWGLGKSTDIYTTEVRVDGTIEWQLTFPDTEWEQEVNDYRAYRSTMIGIAARPYVIDDADNEAVTVYCNWFGHEDEIASYNVYMDETPEATTLYGNTDTGIMVLEGLTNQSPYYIRIKAVNGDGEEISDYSNEVESVPTNVKDQYNNILPKAYVLGQNYPNPFNPTTQVDISLPNTSKLIVKVYNLLGQDVAVLYNGIATAGVKNLAFDGSGLTSGVYLVRAEVPGKMNQVRKIVLMK